MKWLVTVTTVLHYHAACNITWCLCRQWNISASKVTCHMRATGTKCIIMSVKGHIFPCSHVDYIKFCHTEWKQRLRTYSI